MDMTCLVELSNNRNGDVRQEPWSHHKESLNVLALVELVLLARKTH